MIQSSQFDAVRSSMLQHMVSFERRFARVIRMVRVTSAAHPTHRKPPIQMNRVGHIRCSSMDVVAVSTQSWPVGDQAGIHGGATS